MPCYTPLHAYKDKSTDPQKMRIAFRRTDSWRGEKLELPCGQCIGCRLERSRQWAVRCMHEASLYENNCFITLTYRTENLPKNNSLDKTHFQKFMKRLRKEYGPKIRYYHCGEYGETYGRPHYHAILFNHQFNDLERYVKLGEHWLYTSKSLDKIWNQGHTFVGTVTFDSAGYVARYIMKKITGKAAEKHYGDRLPEYSTMSRGSNRIGSGGIGKGWYDKFKTDVYPLDRIIVRGNITRPPRFYDTLLGREDPSTLALIKIKREKTSNRYVQDVLSNGKVIKESDSSTRRLAVKEEVKKSEIRNLARDLDV